MKVYKKDMQLHYKLLGEIGRGGRGAVRLCKHNVTHETFACKTVKKSSMFLDDDTSRIDDEISIHGSMRCSRRVAKLVDVYEDDSHVHILTEYMSGGDLDTHRIIPESVARDYMRGVLEALYDCHAEHIIHKDVKPANFVRLSDESCEVKLIDFGLSKSFVGSELPLTDLRIEGTVCYMAPECFQGSCHTASDVWSAGVTAYYLLSSQFPFSGRDGPEDTYRVVRSIMNKDPAFSGHVFSPAAEDFIRMMLQKRACNRPTAYEALMHPWLN
jgi:calcium-dependent protein kinase